MESTKKSQKNHFHCNNCDEECQTDHLERCSDCLSYNVEFINYTDEEIECSECEGEGYNEIGPECNQPASNCCGGCYVKQQCEACDGSGSIENENFEE